MTVETYLVHSGSCQFRRHKSTKPSSNQSFFPCSQRYHRRSMQRGSMLSSFSQSKCAIALLPPMGAAIRACLSPGRDTLQYKILLGRIQRRRLSSEPRTRERSGRRPSDGIAPPSSVNQTSGCMPVKELFPQIIIIGPPFIIVIDVVERTVGGSVTIIIERTSDQRLKSEVVL